MSLPVNKKFELRRQVHHLKPVVMLGQHGLTPAVNAEIDQALTAHELIKIRISGQEREDKKAVTEEICKTHNAELIQAVGHIIAIYRARPK